jgi:hypothetical protein
VASDSNSNPNPNPGISHSADLISRTNLRPNGYPVESHDTDSTTPAESKFAANLQAQKVLGFFSNLPTVSKEVALKVADQLPELRKVATKALGSFERMHKNTLDNNEASQAKVHDAYQDIRDVLKGELKAEDLTWGQKKEIYDLLLDTGKEEFTKDTENKRALDAWLKSAGVIAVAALAVCVVLVGAKSSDA